MAGDPRATYEERRAAWNAAIADLDRRHLSVSNLRLLAMALLAAALWLSFGRAAFSPLWALLPAAFFFGLVVRHAGILNARDRAVRSRRYFDRGIDRLNDAWAGGGAGGERFAGEHPYARDLDLFGRGSLFELLNTATTEIGEETLAAWLRAPAALPIVRARQAAVAELRERLDVRETLAMFAADARVTRTGALAGWAETSPAGLAVWQGWLLAGLAAVTAVVAGLAFRGVLPIAALALWLGIQALAVLPLRRRVWRVLRGVDAAAYDLSSLSSLLERIEGFSFESPSLRRLSERLRPEGVPPSRRFARLRWYLAARDSLRNEFVRPFALALVVRSQSAVAIDRWHAANRQHLAGWLEVIGELEACAALAAFAFEHPGDPFPALADAGVSFAAARLAHPLLPGRSAVANDVRLGGDAPHVLIVSGSNMSGKSTLLRAIGVNVVLALAGATVRASAMSLSLVSLGATLRVEDSLQEGQSRFYAEVLRIRDIVAAAERGPVLFLLDEILHGTNSHDRRIGAEAIVKALVEAGAIGLVTTHDLALTALPQQLGSARNVHFEDRIENGRMMFDYVMRDGVVERSNAIELMRAVGLKV